MSLFVFHSFFNTLSSPGFALDLLALGNQLVYFLLIVAEKVVCELSMGVFRQLDNTGI